MPHVLAIWVCVIGIVAMPAAAQDQRNSTPLPIDTQPFSSRFQQWGLPAEDLQRLNAVYEIERAFTDVDSLTPYEILGKHAKTESERNRYARQYVQATIEHQRRSLEWGVAVAAALNTEDFTRQLFSSTLQSYMAQQGYKGFVSGGSGDASALLSAATSEGRIHAFVVTNDCESCDESFSRALSMVGSNGFTGVDIVFTDLDHEDQKSATEWAIRNGISSEMVADRTITLNFDTPSWQKERKNAAVPLLIDSRTGAVMQQ